MTLSSRSTFLCVSTSAGDLMKFDAEVKTLCKSISVSIFWLPVFSGSLTNWANVRGVRRFVQIRGVVSNVSI